MALIPSAHTALTDYVVRSQASGAPAKATVKEAVILTAAQVEKATALLSALWGRAYPCPGLLDLKPAHGYASRVGKDGYTGDQYVEWLSAGCSDDAMLEADDRGRPNLRVNVTDDNGALLYAIVVPLRSDALGYVHVDDVIPKGL